MMDRNKFFSFQISRNYIESFDKHLMGLPKNEREKYVEEIKNDLLENALERSNDKSFDEKIVKETIHSFASPSELANSILDEHKDDFSNNHQPNKTAAQIFTNFSAAGLLVLSVPIILGFLNIGATLPFFLALIIGTIWIVWNRNIFWNNQMSNYFKKTIKFTQTGYIILGFGFFAIRIMIAGELDSFTLYYTILYLLLGTAYIFLLRVISSKKIVLSTTE